MFILDNARQKPDDKTEKGQSYVVVGASEDLPFAANLNHEVSVTGSADASAATPPAAGEKAARADHAAVLREERDARRGPLHDPDAVDRGVPGRRHETHEDHGATDEAAS